MPSLEEIEHREAHASAPPGRRAGAPGPIAGLLAAARRGERASLARLVSMVERGGDPAREVGRLAFPLGGAAYSVGITGPPGVGKSTLVDGLITLARAAEVPVAVLAVDPSSPFSGGALLGDRVRMQGHALDPGVFIRSVATRGHLGGLALAVPEVMRVLDAAGFPLVVVETVGVGQVEVEVAGTTDTTVVVLTPGSGDGVQANKAGLLEVADVFVINKADRHGVKELRRDLATMLALSGAGDWLPPIVETVASSGDGVAGAWEAITAHRRFLDSEGRLERRRAERLDLELARLVARLVEEGARRAVAGPELDSVRGEMLGRRLDPYDAAERVLARMGLRS